MGIEYKLVNTDMTLNQLDAEHQPNVTRHNSVEISPSSICSDEKFHISNISQWKVHENVNFFLSNIFHMIPFLTNRPTSI